MALSFLLTSMSVFADSGSLALLSWDNSLGVWDFECTLDAVGSCPESQDAKDLSEMVDAVPFSDVLRSNLLSRSARTAGLIS